SGLRAYWTLAALVVGLSLGALAGGLPAGARLGALGVAGFVGTLWLNALKMTVIPLVVALLVVGIAKSREAALGGRIAGRSVLWALALGRISEQGRHAIVAIFEAIADALLVIIDWVLWIAPLGVLALAFTVGVAAGGAAFTGLGHYVVVISVIGILVTLAGYP